MEIAMKTETTTVDSRHLGQNGLTYCTQGTQLTDGQTGGRTSGQGAGNVCSN